MPRFVVERYVVSKKDIAVWRKKWEDIWAKQRAGVDDDGYIPICPYCNERCVMDMSLQNIKNLKH